MTENEVPEERDNETGPVFEHESEEEGTMTNQPDILDEDLAIADEKEFQEEKDEIEPVYNHEVEEAMSGQPTTLDEEITMTDENGGLQATTELSLIRDKQSNEVSMEMGQKLDYLLSQIDADLKKFNRLRKFFGRFGVMIKLLTLSLSAVVTILLGLNLEASLIVNRTALAISALIGVIGGISAFFDFQELSLKYKDTIDKLERLKIRIKYITIGVDYLKPNKPDELMAELIKILKDTHDYFQEVRSDDKASNGDKK